jgi:tetratricopeptide (TPR) repeat protein
MRPMLMLSLPKIARGAGIVLTILVPCSAVLLACFWKLNSDRPEGDPPAYSAAPAFLKANHPREYSQGELAHTLGASLTTDQLRLVVDPISANSAKISTRANEIVSGATNRLKKAYLLYKAILDRPKGAARRLPRPLTAEEALAALDNDMGLLRCGDLVFLFVSMARAAGLSAYVVDVQRDRLGKADPHLCAAVFLENGALLVDPAYSLFGVRHKAFTVIDDLQVIAAYMSELLTPQTDEIAYRLGPELFPVQVAAFTRMVNEERWKDARMQVAVLQHLAPGSPMASWSRAVVAEHDGDFEAAERIIARALPEAPHSDALRSLLGDIYLRQEKWKEARQAFESALVCALYEPSARISRQAIAFATARDYASRGDWAAAATNYDASIAAGPEVPQAYAYRGQARQELGDLDGAFADYVKAADSGPSAAFGMVPAFIALGYARYDRHQYSQALQAFAQARRFGSSDYHVAFRIFLLRQLLATPTGSNDIFVTGSQYGGGVWPDEVSQFLTQHLSAEDLVRSAEAGPNSAEKLCEAFFYIATTRLTSGDTNAARSYFTRCLSTGASHTPEFSSSRAELEFLNSGRR